MIKGEYIERKSLEIELKHRLNFLIAMADNGKYDSYTIGFDEAVKIVKNFTTADVYPVRHGRWILEPHDEGVNYRWNVTAECSECCDERKEIWAGFFPNVPPSIARGAALVSAESVKLSNYCPNCGAKMDGDIK